MIDDIIDGTDIKRYTAVFLFKRDVGETSDIETIVVIGKKQPVADRNERGALSAQHDVQTTEIGYGGNTGFGSNSRPVTYLEHNALLRFVENSVPVRSDNIGVHIELSHKVIHPLSQKLTIRTMECDEFECSHLLGSCAKFLF